MYWAICDVLGHLRHQSDACSARRHSRRQYSPTSPTTHSSFSSGKISTLPVSAVRDHARKHAAAYQRRHEFDSCLSAQCSIQTPSNSGIIRRRCGIAPFDFRPCRIPTQKRQESTPQSTLARTRSRFAPSASYPHASRSFCCASPNAGHTGCRPSLQSQSACPTRGSNAFCPSRRRGMHSKRDPRDCRHASYVMVIVRRRILIFSATLSASSIFTTSAIGASK